MAISNLTATGQTSEVFDPAGMKFGPLQLVEASAGTGKTYSITSLYLRLLLEEGLSVEQILVLSFTEAATSELHQRLRSRLSAALRAFRLGGDGEDAFLDSLVKKSNKEHIKQHINWLKAALEGIDQAAVFTIHGFCQRMLKQGAFESSAPFEMELLRDTGPILRELVHDYLSRQYHQCPLRLSILLDIGIDRWEKLAGLALGHRYFPVLNGDGSEAEEKQQTDLLLSHYQRARELWYKDKENICRLVGTRKMRSEFAKRFIELPFALNHFFRTMPPGKLIPPKDSEMLSLSRLNDLKKGPFVQKEIKDGNVPVHDFFNIWDDYIQQLETLVPLVRGRAFKGLVDWSRVELPKRLEQQGLQSFDDLLCRLYESLLAPADANRQRNASLFPAVNRQMADFIARRYPVALIDEFQDTDPVQYRIFKSVYQQPAGKDSGGRRQLVLIGDPKQAIYGFRGADIFAYLNAAADAAGHRYSMDCNYRADPSMVEAVNSLFSLPANPFLLKEIAFHPVKARPEAKDRWQGGACGGERPMQFLHLPQEIYKRLRGDGKRKISGGKLEGVITKLVAKDIKKLLVGKASISLEDSPSRPGLRPMDIAVLVRTHYQGEGLQQALGQEGVKSIIYSKASVFESSQAQQLEIFLNALLEHSHDAQRRAAMLSDLVGCGVDELKQTEQDEQLWQQWLTRFNDWSQRWRDRGFMPMIRSLGEETGLSPRLLLLPDGERQLTNYRHLFELIHKKEKESHLRPTALLKWFSETRQEGGKNNEANELLLESDEAAVKILTIHKSKGLEFPVVYCPFLWKGKSTMQTDKEDFFIFHDPDDDSKGKLSLLPGERECRLQAKESFAEELRLLYVALTRARHACMLVWEGSNNYHTTALAWLLHKGDLELAKDTGRDGLLAELVSQFASNKCIQIRDLAGKSPPDDELAAPEQQPELSARFLDKRLSRAWSVGSFSSLAANATHPAPEDKGKGADRQEALSRFDEQSSGFIPEQDYDAIGNKNNPPLDPLFGRIDQALFSAGQGLPDDTSQEDLLSNRLLIAQSVPLADFPAGLAAGNLVHHILEEIDFSDSSAWDEIVSKQLTRQYGSADSGMTAQLIKAFDDLVSTPLAPFKPGEEPPGEQPLKKSMPETISLLKSTPMLKLIDRAQRLDELEFILHLPADKSIFTPATIAGLFRRYGFPEYQKSLKELGFRQLKGFLRGFIDLVFCWQGRWYIVDYKSNRLGPCYSDYQQKNMLAAMQSHHYLLQYHIYTLALHRYLSHRLPGYQYEKDFGGVYYLFIRGMHPKLCEQSGVYFDLPQKAMITELNQLAGGDAYGVDEEKAYGEKT